MVELAEIFRQGGAAYRETHRGRMLPSHLRAMDDIVRCRTPPLGGSLYACDECGNLEYAYHSCRNRHCPKCHHLPTQRWLERLRSRLLPCPYAFLTFTLPAELRRVARSNQRLVYGILLRQAAAAVQRLADDRQWVGACLGILAVLHTWSRDLAFHPHVHLLVTGGGMTPCGNAWRKPAHPHFLVPGYALSRIFRAKVRDAFHKADLDREVEPRAWTQPWTVHVKRAGSGEHATRYLSRYVYRVAITNPRIERLENGRVTFRYIHSRTRQTRRMSLPVDAFIARFLQHVLPRGFHKIRYYGLFSPTARDRHGKARDLLERQAKSRSAQPSNDSSGQRTEANDRNAHKTAAHPSSRPQRLCPVCRSGHLHLVAIAPKRQRAPP